MPERIKYEGRDATAGACKSCGLILIVTDKDPQGSFCTYHEQPMCQWYLDRCSSPLTEDIGDCVFTRENTEFI